MTLIVVRPRPVGAEIATQVCSPLDVAIGSIEFHPSKLLQMSRLGVDEEFIDRGDFEVVDQSKIDSHADTREQVHRLFGADSLGRAEDAVGAAYAVVERLLALADQEVAGLALVL